MRLFLNENLNSFTHGGEGTWQQCCVSAAGSRQEGSPFHFGAQAFDHTLWERLAGLAKTVWPRKSTLVFLGFTGSDSGVGC